jgi:hypothetical protein
MTGFGHGPSGFQKPVQRVKNTNVKKFPVPWRQRWNIRDALPAAQRIFFNVHAAKWHVTMANLSLFAPGAKEVEKFKLLKNLNLKEEDDE